MGTSALRRLVAEYKQILKNSPDGIIAGPGKILLCIYVIWFLTFWRWKKIFCSQRRKLFWMGGCDYWSRRNSFWRWSIRCSFNVSTRLSVKSANNEVYIKNFPSEHLSRWPSMHFNITSSWWRSSRLWEKVYIFQIIV